MKMEFPTPLPRQSFTNHLPPAELAEIVNGYCEEHRLTNYVPAPVVIARDNNGESDQELTLVAKIPFNTIDMLTGERFYLEVYAESTPYAGFDPMSQPRVHVVLTSHQHRSKTNWKPEFSWDMAGQVNDMASLLRPDAR